ncbi:substrate-binding domain-containing protein [Chryseobacterium sp. Bi04]|uniref:substrate-binding domain-containing protein n=1 Tax=Chryseobacterium sp. Bi04 TaxID=2822345 RepID=UPI0033AB4F79
MEGIEEIIDKLPKADVYIIDQMRDSLKKYPGIYQDFIEDIYNAMESSLNILSKYKEFILIFPGNKEPIDMVNGFVKFCTAYKKKYQIIPDLQKHSLKKGQLFLIPNDRQLVETVEKCKSKNLKIGKDIGIISYNEMPLKKIVENGITTLSTDFYAMGYRLSEMILKNEQIQIKNPSKLYLRNSL